MFGLDDTSESLKLYLYFLLKKKKK